MLTMLRPYINDARIGDGYRAAFLLGEDKGTATLYLPPTGRGWYASIGCDGHGSTGGTAPLPAQGHDRGAAPAGCRAVAIEATLHAEPPPEMIAARERRVVRAT